MGKCHPSTPYKNTIGIQLCTFVYPLMRKHKLNHNIFMEENTKQRFKRQINVRLDKVLMVRRERSPLRRIRRVTIRDALVFYLKLNEKSSVN